MDIYVARQPIFDRRRKVVAYELLFRSGLDNFFAHHDADEASSRVIDGSLLGFGLDRVTGGKQAFLNFTRRVLVNGVHGMLPPNAVVVELLETVDPDDEVLEKCRELKESGYTLALDDFVVRPDYERLVELADIIKVDFRASPPEERAELAKRFAKNGIRLLAEKVETGEEFDEALDLGYDFFQGYFFCKPEIVAGKDIPALKVNYLKFIDEVNRPELDFDALERVIKHELSLSVKLLRYLNSASFGWRHEVISIKQAIMLLGEQPIKKWASLVALSGVGEDKPAELVVDSLIRARFCELAGMRAGVGASDLELFLLGLLSRVDALVDQPLEQVLDQMTLSQDVRNTLLGDESALKPIHTFTEAYQRGQWDQATRLAGDLGLEEVTPTLYSESVEWADEVYRPV